jgi:hypothetical protein
MAAYKLVAGVSALLVLLAACAAPATEAKKTAAEAALKSIDDAYQERNGALFNSRMATARQTIERARQSGDPKRQADVQINLELDSCEQEMLTWQSFSLEQSIDDITSRVQHKEEKESHEASFRAAIDRLREDLK